MTLKQNRTFQGKKFVLQARGLTKTAAMSHKKGLRAKGYYIRIVHASNGYNVYRNTSDRHYGAQHGYSSLTTVKNHKSLMAKRRKK